MEDNKLGPNLTNRMPPQPKHAVEAPPDPPAPEVPDEPPAAAQAEGRPMRRLVIITNGTLIRIEAQGVTDLEMDRIGGMLQATAQQKMNAAAAAYNQQSGGA